MAKPLSKPQKPSWRLSLLLRGHWRLFISALLCVLVVFLLPVEYRLVSRLLVGWDTGIALYLALVFTMIARSDTSHMRRHAALEDEGRIAIPILMVIAAMASLGAIMFWLRTASESEADQPSILALLFLTTLQSWVFIHVIFALHYAHEFYAEHRGEGGGLLFPGCKQPNYWDFLYLAFSIGTSSAVSDVQVTSRTIRKTVWAHGIVSFIFNVTLIALTVSIAADAVRSG